MRTYSVLTHHLNCIPRHLLKTKHQYEHYKYQSIFTQYAFCFKATLANNGVICIPIQLSEDDAIRTELN